MSTNDYELIVTKHNLYEFIINLIYPDKLFYGRIIDDDHKFRLLWETNNKTHKFYSQSKELMITNQSLDISKKFKLKIFRYGDKKSPIIKKVKFFETLGHGEAAQLSLIRPSYKYNSEYYQYIYGSNCEYLNSLETTEFCGVTYLEECFPIKTKLDLSRYKDILKSICKGSLKNFKLIDPARDYMILKLNNHPAYIIKIIDIKEMNLHETGESDTCIIS